MKTKIERDATDPVAQDPDKDLQIIFKQLRVDCKPKRLCQRTRIRSHSWSEGSKRISSPKKKPLIKQANFIYKSKCMDLRSKGKKLEKYCLDQQKKAANRKELSSPVSGPVSDTLFTSRSQRPSQSQRAPSGFPSASCSGQFRRAQCSKINPASVNVNSDDTTPDELAAYFELLHIPKPMSAMAEMMYT